MNKFIKDTKFFFGLMIIAWIIFVSIGALGSDTFINALSKATTMMIWVIVITYPVFAISSLNEKKEQERAEKERQKNDKEERRRIKKEQEKIEKEEKERKKNTWKEFKSWEPTSWKDKTNSIYKIAAEIWGRFDEIENQWNLNTRSLIFDCEKEKHWLELDDATCLDIDINLNKFAYLGTEIIIKRKTMTVFFYDDDWYMTYKEISLEDAIVLIEATKLKEKKKFQQEIERARNMVEGSNEKRHRQRISEDIQTFVWNRDNGKCVKCGSQENLEFDHIIPFSKGGSNTARNLQLLCEEYNRQKGNRL